MVGIGTLCFFDFVFALIKIVARNNVAYYMYVFFLIPDPFPSGKARVVKDLFILESSVISCKDLWINSQQVKLPQMFDNITCSSGCSH